MTTHNIPPTRRNSDLRRRNSLEVLDHLRRHGRLARAELTKFTTLSNQALATILNELVESGHAIEVETRGLQRGRGRPALLYEYNAERHAVVSLFVGLRYCEVVVCDGLGRPITNHVEFSPGWDVGQIVDEASAHIDELLRTARIERTVCHVAAVVHGWVDEAAGIATSVNMGWDEVALGERITERTGMTATVHEASRAAAIAEYREGAAAGTHRAVVLNIGAEISATMVTDGVLDTGSGGSAGMLGACRVPGPDGRLTTLDDLVGSFALKARYMEASGNHVDWVTDVYLLARAGDEVARRVIEFSVDVFGLAASWLITVTNPERFVLTGAPGGYDEQTRSRMHARTVELTDPRLLHDCTIHFTSLGRQAWIRGGVHAALDHQRSNDPLARGT